MSFFLSFIFVEAPTTEIVPLFYSFNYIPTLTPKESKRAFLAFVTLVQNDRYTDYFLTSYGI